MKNCKIAAVFGMAMLGLNGLTHAATIIVDPTSAVDGNTGYLGLVSATDTINSTGLSDGGASVTTGSAIPASFPTVTPNLAGFTDNYDTDDMIGPSGVVITYSLDKAYTITGGHFWQYSGDYEATGERSLTSAEVWVSTDGMHYTDAGTLTPGYVEGRPYGTPDPGVNFSLTSTANVVSIQLRDLMAPGDPNITAAFNEIRFFANTPEPASLGLLALGGLGFLRRRRA